MFALIVLKDYFYDRKHVIENRSVAVFGHYNVNESIVQRTRAKAGEPIGSRCVFDPGYPVSCTRDIPNVKGSQCVCVCLLCAGVPLSICPLYSRAPTET